MTWGWIGNNGKPEPVSEIMPMDDIWEAEEHPEVEDATRIMFCPLGVESRTVAQEESKYSWLWPNFDTLGVACPGVKENSSA